MSSNRSIAAAVDPDQAAFQQFVAESHDRGDDFRSHWLGAEKRVRELEAQLAERTTIVRISNGTAFNAGLWGALGAMLGLVCGWIIFALSLVILGSSWYRLGH